MSALEIKKEYHDYMWELVMSKCENKEQMMARLAVVGMASIGGVDSLHHNTMEMIESDEDKLTDDDKKYYDMIEKFYHELVFVHNSMGY